jgi:hypothetical protein
MLWLFSNHVTHVAMESTGVYWKPVWNVLEGKFTILLVNPQHMKALPGRKTDQKDSEWIAELLQHGLLRASFIPAREIRELGDLTGSALNHDGGRGIGKRCATTRDVVKLDEFVGSASCSPAILVRPLPLLNLFGHKITPHPASPECARQSKNGRTATAEWLRLRPRRCPHEHCLAAIYIRVVVADLIGWVQTDDSSSPARSARY